MSLAGRYDNPIPILFLVPHRMFKNSSSALCGFTLAGPTRRPAWLAGGECPGRCDFVHDGQAVLPAFSVPYRLP